MVRPAMAVPTMSAANTAVNSGSVLVTGAHDADLPERSA